ncbi:hypothetical protein AcV7_006036 [Taiwanofungus camphoratus]|nr:hypothetical protein AcV7_006036 [Antrodia cinnamomea]
MHRQIRSQSCARVDPLSPCNVSVIVIQVGEVCDESLRVRRRVISTTAREDKATKRMDGEKAIGRTPSRAAVKTQSKGKQTKAHCIGSMR